MTKLVKYLIAGGSTTAVVGGGAAGAAIAISHKSSNNDVANKANVEKHNLAIVENAAKALENKINAINEKNEKMVENAAKALEDKINTLIAQAEKARIKQEHERELDSKRDALQVKLDQIRVDEQLVDEERKEIEHEIEAGHRDLIASIKNVVVEQSSDLIIEMKYEHMDNPVYAATVKFVNSFDETDETISDDVLFNHLVVYASKISDAANGTNLFVQPEIVTKLTTPQEIVASAEYKQLIAEGQAKEEAIKQSTEMAGAKLNAILALRGFEKASQTDAGFTQEIEDSIARIESPSTSAQEIKDLVSNIESIYKQIAPDESK